MVALFSNSNVIVFFFVEKSNFPTAYGGIDNGMVRYERGSKRFGK